MQSPLRWVEETRASEATNNMYPLDRKMYVISLVIILMNVGFLAHSNDNKETFSTNQESRFLILGGNGFIGSSFVVKLLSAGGHVTVLNRGSSYFDSRSRIDPFVESLVCDRTDIYKCTQLVKSTQYYDAVIDFTSYHKDDLRDVLEVVRERYGRYIYISSDSVYEVCAENQHGGPSREEDAIRPSDPQEQHALNRKDSYGHRKLECEEVLQQEKAAHDINFVSLRLPDVIGPRDTTDRFWNYQIWLQSHHLVGTLGPIHLNPKKNVLLSFAYSEDIAELIFILLGADLEVLNEAYNVAFDEMVTLEEFLEMMAESLGIKHVSFDRTQKANRHWFPSVTRGPVNITKILTKLSWKPTPIKKAIHATCQFYKDAMNVPNFQRRRDNIMGRNIKDKQTWNRFLKEQGVDLGLYDEL